MTTFTRFGSSIWSWEPWVNLPSDAARHLWLALYTSERAKTLLPGLWHGSVLSMADSARQQPQDTYQNLDTLLSSDNSYGGPLVEYDDRSRVLRLTELPDAGEWPSAPFMLTAWWKRFHSVPDCAVRNAHVALMRWLLETGAREAGKGKKPGKPSLLHEEIWSETFGTVPHVVSRRRGVRRLCESDTSNGRQGSLFASPVVPAPLLLPSQASSGGTPDGTYPQGSGSDGRQPGSDPKPNDNTVPEYHPGGYGEGEGEGEGERGSSFSSGRGGSLERPVDRTRTAPRLSLVPPPPVPFTVDELVGALAAGFGGKSTPALAEAAREPLGRAIEHLALVSAGLDDLRILSEWVASGGIRSLESAVAKVSRDGFVAWASDGSNLVVAMQRARTWAADKAQREAHALEMAEVLRRAREESGQ